jgi:hypothetical protein
LWPPEIEKEAVIHIGGGSWNGLQEGKLEALLEKN